MKSSNDAVDQELESRRVTARNYQNAGNIAEAISAWNMVLALEPTDPNAKRQIEILKNEFKANELITTAVAFMDNQKYTKAVNCLVDAQNLRPNDETIISLLNQARAKSSTPTDLEDIKSNSDH